MKFFIIILVMLLGLTSFAESGQPINMETDIATFSFIDIELSVTNETSINNYGVNQITSLQLDTVIHHVLYASDADGIIDLTVSNGTAPYTYIWSTGATTEDINNLTIGSYYVTITDANSLTATGSFTIMVLSFACGTSTMSDYDNNVYTTVQIGNQCWMQENMATTHYPNGTVIPNVTTDNAWGALNDNNIDDAYSWHEDNINYKDTSGALYTWAAVMGDNAVSSSSNPSGTQGICPTGWHIPSDNEWMQLEAELGMSQPEIDDIGWRGTDQGSQLAGNSSLWSSTYSSTIENNPQFATSGFDALPGSNRNYYNGMSFTYYIDGSWWSSTESNSSQAWIRKLQSGHTDVSRYNISKSGGLSVRCLKDTVLFGNISFSTTNNLCNGNANGIIELTTYGGISPFTYFWSNGATTQDISNLASGVYTVTATDTNGTSIIDSCEITEPSALVLSALVYDVTITGGNDGAIDLSVTGGIGGPYYSYLWSTGSTSFLVYNLSAGSYTVTVTDDNGCIAIETYIVSDPVVLLLLSGVTGGEICYGTSDGSIDITITDGTPPYAILWSDGATIEDRTGLNAGTYAVTVTDYYGVWAIDSFAITEPSVYELTEYLHSDVSCNGGNDGTFGINVIGGVYPYVILWDTGGSNWLIDSLSAGTYAVTCTDDNGCQAIDSFIVSEPAEISVLPGISNVTSFGVGDGAIDITVFGGTSPYTYYWPIGAITQDISGLSPGTYCVSITDVNGCSTVESFNVILNFSTIGTINDILCYGNSDGSIDITIYEGMPPYTYLWSNGATTEDISGLSAGTYSLTVTDSNGQIINDSFQVNEPDSITSYGFVVDINTPGINSGSIDFIVLGGTTPYTYLWADGSTGIIIENLAAGGYFVTATDANGCIITDSFNIYVNFSIVGIVNDSCFNEGSVDITMYGGVPPYTYLWSNGATTEDISGLDGVYSLTVTDSNGSTVSDYFIVYTEPPLIVSGMVWHINTPGNNSGTIDLIISGGNPPYTYLWEDGSTDVIYDNLAAGDYTVTVTDSYGCFETNTFTVNVDYAIIETIDSVACYGDNNGSIEITMYGGVPPYSYLWSNGSTTEDISGLSAGTYSLTVTDSNGQIINDSFQVNEPDSITSYGFVVDISTPGINSGSIDFIVLGGITPYEYLWADGSTGIIVENLAAGDYFVTATDANGCIITDSFNIYVDFSIVGIVNDSCFNEGSVDITTYGGVPPYTYLWSNGATTEDISGLDGVYSLTVTDSNGSTVNDYFIVNTGFPLIVSGMVWHINTPGNNSGTIDLIISGGNPPYTYLWEDGSTDVIYDNLAAGDYTVTVTDSYGCFETNTFTVNVDYAIIETITDLSCYYTNDGSIEITTYGGNPPYSYLWSNGSTTEDLYGLSDGTYSLIVTDSNGMILSNSFVVDDNPILLSSMIWNMGTPGLNNGSLDLIVSGGVLPYTFLWSNGSTLSQLENLAPGDYYITVIDFQGCIAIDTITLAVGYAIVDTINNVLCYGDNNGSIDITIYEGMPPYTYLWSNGATTEDISGLSAGTYSLTLTDSNGQTINDSFQVNEPDSLTSYGFVVDISTPGINSGSIDFIVLGGTTPYAYLWADGSTGIIVENLAAGDYFVTATDANGCIISDSFNIYVDFSIVGIVNDSCFNEGSVDITTNGGVPPYTYLWSNGATTEDISGLDGVYSLTVTDSNGSTVTDYFIVNTGFPLIVSGMVWHINTPGNNSGTIDLIISGGNPPYTYLWEDGSTDVIYDNLAAGDYTVTVTDSYGCFETNTFTVNVDYAIIETIDSVACYGDNNGSIEITMYGGVPPYSYLWSNGSTTEDLYGLSDGTYSLTVTDSNGQIINDSFQVNEPDSLTSYGFVANISTPGINSGSIDFIVLGGTTPYTYLWADGSTGIIVENLASGDYFVTATDANGCIITDSFNIYVDYAIVSTIEDLCYGEGSIDIALYGGMPPYTYLWSNGAATEDISGLTDGSYSLTVTDSNGLTINNSFQINTNDQIQISAMIWSNGTPGQNNGSFDLLVSGGVAPYTYLWSDGFTGSMLEYLALGYYYVTVTDAVGCMANDSILLSVGYGLAYTVNDVQCYGNNDGSINVSPYDGIQPYSYLWSNGATTEDISGLSIGSYSLTVTDSNGCSLNNTFIVNTIDQIQISAMIWTHGTPGQNNGSFDLLVSGGVTPYTYLWADGFTGSMLEFLDLGYYYVTVTDAVGCVANDSIHLTVGYALSGSISDVLCYSNGDGSIDITIYEGMPPFSYLWSNGATTEDISGLSVGTYSLTVTDSNGQTLNDSFIIDATSQTLISAMIWTHGTPGQNNGSFDLLVSGGVSPYTYLWSDGTTYSELENLGLGYYYVTVTDAVGCVVNDSILITAGYTIDETISNVLCYGNNEGSIDITVYVGTPPYSYLWSNGAITEDISELSEGTYLLTVTDANGIEFNDSFQITEPDAISLSGIVTDVTVSGWSNGIVDLSLSGGVSPYTYSWSTGSIVQDILGLSAGSYTVTVTDDNGCTITEMYEVNEPFQFNIQNIDLPAGWSTMSTYINPTYPQVDSVFSAISNSTVLVKNETGMVYWSAFNLNMIGNMVIGQGYQVNMVSNELLTIEGLAVIPELTPILLESGWGIIGYLRQVPGDAIVMMTSIYNNLVIMKNGEGLVYWPYFNINLIGNMVPGSGYQVKVSDSVTLLYPANPIAIGSVNSKTTISHISPSHYKYPEATSENMTIGIPVNALDINIHSGDEIGVFNSDGDLVGSGLYNGEAIAITVWGIDEIIESGKGCRDNDILSFMHFSNSTGMETRLEIVEWIYGNGSYEKNDIQMVGLITGDKHQTESCFLYQNTPNPFSNETVISFYLPSSTDVSLSVYNMLGVQVVELANGDFKSGTHKIEFNSGNLAKGNYMYRLIAGEYTETKKLSIVR